MRTLFGLMLATAVAGCTPTQGPVPPAQPDADAAPLPPVPLDGATPGTVDHCELSRRHLVAIGCTPPDPENGQWADVCRNGQENGLFALGCINRASTAAAAVKCGVRCGAAVK